MSIPHFSSARKPLTRELKSVLHERLSLLSERERIAVFLRHWRSYSIAEIAAYLRVNWDAANKILGTAYWRLKRDESLRGAVCLFTLLTTSKERKYESDKIKNKSLLEKFFEEESAT